MDADPHVLSPPFDLSGRTVLVTGATSGIGRMIAEGFAACGAELFICARTRDACEAVAARIAQTHGCVCTAVAADVASREGRNDLAARIEARTGRLHCLVNNAGATAHAAIDDCAEADWDRVMDLNLKAPFFLSQAVLPLLRRGAAPSWPAAIVNLGSIGGLRIGGRQNYAYAASKAGLHHLTRSMAKALAPEHIVVNAIAPGPFPSNLSSAQAGAALESLIAQIPVGRSGAWPDVAGLACYLASPFSAFLTGGVVPLDGGMSL